MCIYGRFHTLSRPNRESPHGSMMPNNIVAKEGFKLYTKALNASYNIPSRKIITGSKYQNCIMKQKPTLSPLLIKHIFYHSQRIVGLLDRTNHFWLKLVISLIVNMTQVNLFINYILSSKLLFILLNYVIGSVCLGCVELSEDHTEENLADKLQLFLLDYNLSVPSNNVCCFKTDYGANILKAIKNLRVPHMPCFGHAFNTAVSNIFKLEDIQIAVQKIQSI